MRKTLLATLLALALGTPGFANTITVTPTPIIAGGDPFTWAYAVNLEGFSQVNEGDFFTIFDFEGFISGTQSNNAGWTPSSSNTGVCPSQGPFPTLCAAVDDPAIPNLTWTRTGDAIIGVAGVSTPLGTFYAQSIYSNPVNDFFTSQDDDLQNGTFNEGSGGNTNVPTSQPIPEPATLLLFGTGLAAVARRRFISRR